MSVMRSFSTCVIVIAGLTWAPFGWAQTGADPGSKQADRSDARTGELFENVVAILQERYYDKEFREKTLPGLVEKYRAEARAAVGLERQRQITHEFLSSIPASHLCLLSSAAHERMVNELTNKKSPTFGFDLIELDGQHYAWNVLEGGAAEKAGLARGDRIVSIDGVPVAKSNRLDWRNDDAYLPDPPSRLCLCQEGEVARLNIERRPNAHQNIDVECQPYSSFEAAKASARIYEQDGRKIAYIHFWLIHLTDMDTLLKDKLDLAFADCDALILDLRGRGGSSFMVPRLLDILDGTTSSWRGPVVGLTNRGTRSAKEIIAHEFRRRKIGLLVGETTPGAVVPASTEDVGHDTHLMFPTTAMTEYSKILELVGVRPDVVVEEAGAYSAGDDPILAAGLSEAARLAKKVAQSGAPAQASLTVARLLARMINALGGEDAILRHSSRTLIGTIQTGDTPEGSLTMVAAAPNRLLSTVEVAGRGTQRHGFDGQIGWREGTAGEAVLVTGKELTQMRNRADFCGILNYRKNYPTIKLLERLEFAGEDCYALRLTDVSGNVKTLFVDPQTYLVVGEQSSEVTRAYEEYKEYGGVKLATRIRHNVGGTQEQIITISQVSHRPHDPGVFDLPTGIQELARAATPEVSVLLRKMIDALGGAEAIRRHTTQTLTGTLEMSGRLEATYRQLNEAPRYYLATQDFKGMGVLVEGFDGQNAWHDGLNGTELLEGKELTKLRNQADLYGPLNYDENYTVEATAGRKQFAGKETIELILTDASGSVERVYIDPQTFLTVGRVSTEKGPTGDMTATSTMEEYKVFDGVRMATRTTTDFGGMVEQTLHITDVSFAPHPKGSFDPPDKIKKILEAPKPAGE